MRNLHRSVSLLLVIGLLVSGCARSPEAKKARWLTRGDSYFSRQQYREAIIEYRNVLRVEGTNARAIQQIGLAHYELGELGQAFPFLFRAKELDPNNLDVRLKLGTIYLLGRKPQEAKTETDFVLGKDPKNFDALLLAAGAATAPKEVDVVIKRLEAARPDFGDRAKLHIGLATLYLRKQDMAKAEGAFKEAVAREPKSVEGQMALGYFYTVKGDFAAAEQAYKAAADLAPVDSRARMKLVEFYLRLQKLEEAKRILSEVTQKTPDFLPAWRRLAEIALAEQNYGESLKALEVILKKNPADLEGHLLQGRVHLAKRETTEAIQEFQQVLKLEPRFAQARYQLALAYLQAGNLQQVRVELKEATTVDPTLTDAALLLAELDIKAGALQPAIEAMERHIVKQPKLVAAYVLLGQAYLAKKDPAKAIEAYHKVASLASGDPRGPYLVGIGLLAQGKRAEATKQFEAALALAPDYLDPLAQLVAIAVAEKKLDAALERVKKQIARVPKSARFHDLLGRVYLMRGEMTPSEAALVKALELDPSLIDSYLALGQLYAASGRYDQSLARLNDALKVNPKNLATQMLTGVIYERKGDIPKAQKAYEQALELNPRFAPAANNLAYLYAEHGGDKEKALQLAQMAKEVLPDSARISDTLGWILYKRGVYQRALSLLQESASKLPDSPEVRYHLGMTHFKLGSREAAKQELAKALKSNSQFPGVEEARRTLAELK